MEGFVLSIVENPLRYIEYAFAFMGAVGVLLFFAGWGTGMPHLFTLSESESHMEHARHRAMWGVVLTMVVFGLWEAARVVLGHVPLAYLIWALILTTPLWIPWIRALAGGKSGGH